jgi:hypothetical protein
MILIQILIGYGCFKTGGPPDEEAGRKTHAQLKGEKSKIN